MIERIPYKSPTLDATLRKYPNGKLPDDLLLQIHTGRPGFTARLYGPAAWWYNVMWSTAKAEGITLRSVSRGYRSYATQEALFLDRMSRTATTRVPVVTRKWNGKTWWLKRGKAPVASPGKSSHGAGLAQDIDVNDPKVFAWLCVNGPRFGFYLDGPRTLANGKKNPNFEAWHWTFCNLTK